LESIFSKYDPAIFFVTMVVWQRKKVLATDEVHRAFRDQAEIQHQKGVATMGRYILMPDHVHFFIQPGCDHQLGTAIKFLKEAVTRTLHKGEVKGRIWQPGFFDHLLRTAESYSEKWGYVCENPVRSGLVKSSEDWIYQGEIIPLDR